MNSLLYFFPRDIRRYEHNTRDLFVVVVVPNSFHLDKITIIPITQVKELSDDDGSIDLISKRYLAIPPLLATEFFEFGFHSLHLFEQFPVPLDLG